MLGGMWLCLVPWAAQGVDATALRLRVLLFTAGSEASQTPSALDAFAPGASCQPQPRRAAGLNQTPPGSSQGDRNPGPGSAIRRGDAPAAFASSSPLPGEPVQLTAASLSPEKSSRDPARSCPTSSSKFPADGNSLSRPAAGSGWSIFVLATTSQLPHKLLIQPLGGNPQPRFTGVSYFAVKKSRGGKLWQFLGLVKVPWLVFRAQGLGGASLPEDTFPLYFPKAGQRGAKVEKIKSTWPIPQDPPGWTLGWLVIFNLIDLSISACLLACQPTASHFGQGWRVGWQAAHIHLGPEINNNNNNNNTITGREKCEQGRGGESTTTPPFASVGRLSRASCFVWLFLTRVKKNK
ncbi:uncharacterized protein LOC141936204 isoform X1 [Strix uralensis]|uniref:uncharacterized protein LOC141936204 isoform X1 n=1 Tax=Strix uralensis TaxID=36305 RepID=UPI003DA72215